MMWIEVVSRDGHVYARERIAGDEARIGRAFDNDVVVDDPHVAPHHLHVHRDADGGLVAEDLATLNGLYAERGQVRVPVLSLAGDPGLRIGRTVVRVHDAARPVAAELPMQPPRADARWALLLAVALFAATALQQWLGMTEEPTASRLLMPVVGFALVLAAWVGFWALISRVFSGQARGALMARIALTGLLAAGAWMVVADWLAYLLAWRGMNEHRGLGVQAILVATCYAHMRAIGTRHLRVATAIVGLVVASSALLEYLGSAEIRRTTGERASLGSLKPPVARLAPAVSTADFLAGTDAVRRRVDAARKKDPAGGSGGGLFQSDD